MSLITTVCHMNLCNKARALDWVAQEKVAWNCFCKIQYMEGLRKEDTLSALYLSTINWNTIINFTHLLFGHM